MCSLKDAFHRITGNDSEGALMIPGPEVVADLLRRSGMETTEEQVREEYVSSSWTDDRAFTWTEFRELAEQLGYVSCDDSSSIAPLQDPAPSDPEGETVHAPESLVRTQTRPQSVEIPCIGIEELEDAQLGVEVNHIWQLVRTEDHPRLQSDVNNQFMLHRKAYPNLLQHSEEQIRLDWLKIPSISSCSHGYAVTC